MVTHCGRRCWGSAGTGLTIYALGMVRTLISWKCLCTSTVAFTTLLQKFSILFTEAQRTMASNVLHTFQLSWVTDLWHKMLCNTATTVRTRQPCPTICHWGRSKNGICCFFLLPENFKDGSCDSSRDELPSEGRDGRHSWSSTSAYAISISFVHWSVVTLTPWSGKKLHGKCWVGWRLGRHGDALTWAGASGNKRWWVSMSMQLLLEPMLSQSWKSHSTLKGVCMNLLIAFQRLWVLCTVM